MYVRRKIRTPPAPLAGRNAIIKQLAYALLSVSCYRVAGLVSLCNELLGISNFTDSTSHLDVSGIQFVSGLSIFLPAPNIVDIGWIRRVPGLTLTGLTLTGLTYKRIRLWLPTLLGRAQQIPVITPCYVPNDTVRLQACPVFFYTRIYNSEHTCTCRIGATKRRVTFETRQGSY